MMHKLDAQFPIDRNLSSYFAAFIVVTACKIVPTLKNSFKTEGSCNVSHC